MRTAELAAAFADLNRLQQHLYVLSEWSLEGLTRDNRSVVAALMPQMREMLDLIERDINVLDLASRPPRTEA